MTDPRDLPAAVRTHLARQRTDQTRPIPPEGARPPTRAELEASPFWLRAKALKAIADDRALSEADRKDLSLRVSHYSDKQIVDEFGEKES